MRINDRNIDLLSQYDDGDDVDNQSENLTEEDNTIHIGQCCIDIEQLWKDERCEGDGHYRCKTFLEEPKSQKHYHCPLIYAFPNPYQKGLQIELSTLL